MLTEVHVMRAFNLDAADGNMVGVVADADALDDHQKQRIAEALGLPETAFVSGRTVDDDPVGGRSQTSLRLECFSPARPVAHCGRATIAAFSLLRELGRIGEGWHSVETAQGRREILPGEDEAWLALPPAKYANVLPDSQTSRQVLAALGIDEGALCVGRQSCRADTGNAFLLVPIRDGARLGAITPDFHAISALSRKLDVVGLYVFSPTPDDPDLTARARLFAPLYGIPEQAISEQAAGALACHLREHFGICESIMRIEQPSVLGLGAPNRIDVELQRHDDRVVRVLVGGRTRSLRRFRFEV